jgi:hypothetical protein
VTKVRLFVLTKVFRSEFSAQSLRFFETIKVLQRGSPLLTRLFHFSICYSALYTSTYFHGNRTTIRKAAEARSAYYCTGHSMMRGKRAFPNLPCTTMHDKKCHEKLLRPPSRFQASRPHTEIEAPVSRLSLVRDCRLSAFHVLIHTVL